MLAASAYRGDWDAGVPIIALSASMSHAVAMMAHDVLAVLMLILTHCYWCCSIGERLALSAGSCNEWHE